ncbi:MAG: (Fe-S)-binding protein [Thermodesulfobacteriota bacterium]|nr:(Fe-S)-binding protein [Thermodesulfobacteriota bacterium]
MEKDRPKPVTFRLDFDLRNYLWESKVCLACAMCKYGDWIYVASPDVYDFGWICPMWEWGVADHYGTTGTARLVNALLCGDIEPEYPTVKDVAYRCHLCGGCDMACKRNLELEPLMMHHALRVFLVDSGIGPMSAHKNISERIKRKGNYFGREPGERMAWAREGDVKVAEKSDVLYFPGCYAAYKYPEISQSVATILNKADRPFMLMEGQGCCGYIPFVSGLIKEATATAARSVKQIRDKGVKTVICECADCYRMLKVEYPKMLDIDTKDLGYEVVHSSEYFDRLIKEGSIRPSKEFKSKTTYHDPCGLGRLSESWTPWEGIRDPDDWSKLKPPRNFRRGAEGCYEPPRDVLRSIEGLDLVEMYRHHHNAFCSGSCGGVREAFPEQQKFETDVRLREANYTGAEVLVTANPRSYDIFNESLSRLQSGGMLKNIEEIERRFSGTYTFKSLKEKELHLKDIQDLNVLLASVI